MRSRVNASERIPAESTIGTKNAKRLQRDREDPVPNPSDVEKSIVKDESSASTKKVKRLQRDREDPVPNPSDVEKSIVKKITSNCICCKI
jgi:hypothetical protein